MRINVSYKYMESSTLIDNILDKNFKKIERRIKMFKRDDPIHISVHLERNPHKEQYFCRTHLYLPSSKVLNSEEKGATSAVAINKAFSAITKQLDKLKHRLERHLNRMPQKKIAEPDYYDEE